MASPQGPAFAEANPEVAAPWGLNHMRSNRSRRGISTPYPTSDFGGRIFSDHSTQPIASDEVTVE